jgi:sugar transferase (PEP-CTERM/EpsH1 system associated)
MTVMEPLLYLVHRIPFPPNKGDKIRSYHLLRYLSERYAVHLGTFVDTRDDLLHVPQLDALCASKHVEPLDPRAAKIRSVSGFLTGEALTLPYYRSATLQSWIYGVVAQQRIRKAIVFSSAMAQYVRDMPELRVVLDFVDVDSAKWKEYAGRHAWPASAIYRREGMKLSDFEREAAGRSAANVFVTRGEASLFLGQAPGFERRVHVVQNGVNTDYFAPRAERASPYETEVVPILFTGAMDYWPNIDAVCWFASEVMSFILASEPKARFYIVGMNPAPAVQALASSPGVVVTGGVPDIRPYLQHAAVVVAPLRLARGIQNKVLEAMAMARPVVISAAACVGVTGTPGQDFEVAMSPQEFVDKVLALADERVGCTLGRAARAHILADYAWDRNLAAFDRLLQPGTSEASGAAQRERH